MAAAADDAVNPSPPTPSRILVAVLALLHVAAERLLYLCFALAWVDSAICAATVVAHLAWGEDSAPFVFLVKLMVAGAVMSCGTFFLVALPGVLLCDRFLDDFTPGSCSEIKKSAFGAITREPTQESRKFPRAAVLGLVADLAFILLIAVGILVMTMSSRPMEGSMSRGEMVGSAIADLGLFGISAISCFAIFPAFALDIWRGGQSDRETGLAVADCSDYCSELTVAAVKFCCLFYLAALAALLLCSRFLDEFVLPGSGSESKKSTFEAIMEEATRGLFRYFHVVVLGFVADLASFFLICAGILVMVMSSPVEGSISQGEMVGSVIVDVGLVAIQAISCFVICPAVLFSVWRKYQEDRKETSQFC